MDKKKVIGTIVGVVAFIALVAGATYAWLTNALTVTNANYNTRTINFNVNYTKGTNVTSLPTLGTATPSTAQSLIVKAGLATGSAPGNLTVYLNTSTNNALITDHVIKYSWCITSCSGTDFADHTGTITATGQTPIITNTPLQSSQLDYIVYLWLDGDSITSTHTTSPNNTFSGYISATATQTE